MKSGARGVAAGRNIFMAADPAARTREVRKTLHAHFAGGGDRLSEIARAPNRRDASAHAIAIVNGAERRRQGEDERDHSVD